MNSQQIRVPLAITLSSEQKIENFLKRNKTIYTSLLVSYVATAILLPHASSILFYFYFRFKKQLLEVPISTSIFFFFIFIITNPLLGQDEIRFEIGSTEVMKLDDKTLHLKAPGESVFIGDQAGTNDDGSGNQNTFMGFNAGQTNSSGAANTYLGYKAGFSNLGSSHNTYTGYLAGMSSQSGFSNAFYGSNAGNKNVTGYYNTFIGRSAGFENQIGIQNTLIGKDAGRNILGSGNVCLGHDAGENETGSNRLYIDNSNTSTPLIWGDFMNDQLRVNGFFSIGDAYTFPVTDGQYGEVLISDGFGQLSWSPSPDINKLTDADLDTRIQVEASTDEDKIRFKVAGENIATFEDLRLAMDRVNIGTGAGGSNTVSNNVHIGNNAGSAPNIGANVAIGESALSGAYQFAISSNVAVGFSAMGVGAGEQSTAVGYQALRDGGNFNAAVGHNALKNGGIWSVAMGWAALEENEGIHCVGIGYQALYPNQGSHNTAMGSLAMKVNKQGFNNTGVGANAMGGNLNGDNNTALGVNALANVNGIDVNRNTSIGGLTLLSNTGGDDLTALGYAANVTNANLQNATVIGANATVSCSDCLVLDTDANVGIRTSNPQADLHIKHQSTGSNGYGLRLENSNSGDYFRLYTASTGILWMYSHESPTSTIAEMDPVSGLWTAVSDARKKKNIQQAGKLLPKILQLNPKSYLYKGQADSRPEHIGFLAQEVQPLFPSLVNYNAESDNYTMNYSGFGVLAIAAVQELVVINDELEREVEEQEAVIQSLDERIKVLEKMVLGLGFKVSNESPNQRK